MSLEAFTICQSASLQNSNENLVENDEIAQLYEEIKKKPPKDIEKSEIQNFCVALILLQKQKIHPIKCFSLCFNDKIIKTKTDAEKLFNHYYKVLLVYVIVIPLCFLVIAVLNRRALEKTTPRTIISIIKSITTIYCIYQLITFVKNLEHCLPDYGLVTKFFCVKLIILFVIIQSIVLGFVKVETEEYSAEEMEHIINYFLLNLENCLMGFLWIYSFGYGGLKVEKFKNLKKKPSSTTELRFRDGIKPENYS